MGSLHSPASIMDLATCAGTCSPFKWGAIRSQAERGRTWVLRDDAGEAIACGGIMSDGGAWFIAAPAASSRLVALVRAVRRILAGNVPAVVLVEVKTPAGARLARLVGFNPSSGTTWVYSCAPSSHQAIGGRLG